MLVILKENIENLGHTGDLVKVSDGYARNYLLPRGFVVLANERNKAHFEHQKRLLEKKRQSELLKSQEIAKKLEGVSCTLARKVAEKDRLFGSVSALDIIHALESFQITVDKRSVLLDQPIKTLGHHDVMIKLEPDLVVTLKVQVIAESSA